MPEPDDQLQIFYNNLLSTGRVNENDLGGYQYFRESITMPEMANVFYENLISQRGFKPEELGDYNTFYKNMVSLRSHGDPEFVRGQRVKQYDTALQDLDKQISSLDSTIIAKKSQPVQQPELSLSDRMKQATKLYGERDMGLTYKVREDMSPESEIGENEIEQLSRTRNYLTDAKNFTEIAKRRAEVGDDESFKAFAKGLTSPLAKDFFTMGLGELARTTNVVHVARKANEGKSLNDQEQTLLTTYGLLQQELQQPGSMSFNVGAGISEMIPYMVQFAATDGAGSVAKAGMDKLLGVVAKESIGKYVKEAGLKAGLKQIVKELPGLAVKGAAQVPLMPMSYTMIGQKLTGEVSPEGIVTDVPSVPIGILKGLAQAYPEIFTESLGAHLIAPFSAIGGKIGGMSAFKLKPLLTSVEKFRKAAAFGNFAEEYAEEMANNLMSGALDPDATIKQNFSLENMATTALTIAAMGGGFYASNKGYKLLDEAMLRRNLDDVPENVKKDVLKVAGLKTPAEVAKGLNTILTTNDLDKDQVKGVLTYTMKRAMRDGMGEAVNEFTKIQGEQMAREGELQKAQDYVNTFAYKDGQNIITITKAGDETPYFVKDGQVTIDPNGVVTMGNDPVVVVDPAGNKSMLHPKDVSEVKAQRTLDFVNSAIAEYDMGVNNAKLAEEAIKKVTEQFKEAEAPPMFITGDKITYKGKEYEIQNASEQEKKITVYSEDEVFDIPASEYAGITKEGSKATMPPIAPQAPQAAATTEPGADRGVQAPVAAQPKTVELESRIGKTAVKWQFKAQDDGTYTMGKPVETETMAKNIATSLGKRYGNLEFTVVNTTNQADPFAKNEFIVQATPKAAAPVEVPPPVAPAVTPSTPIQNEPPVTPSQAQAVPQAEPPAAAENIPAVPPADQGELTAAQKWERDNFTPEEITKRREYGLTPEKEYEPTFRGTSLRAWKEIENGGTFSAEGLNEGITYVTPSKKLAQERGKGKTAEVLVEFKPEARAKMSGGTEFDEKFDSVEYFGRDLTIDDVLRVTDQDGNVIFDSEQQPKPQEEPSYAEEIREGTPTGGQEEGSDRETGGRIRLRDNEEPGLEARQGETPQEEVTAPATVEEKSLKAGGILNSGKQGWELTKDEWDAITPYASGIVEGSELWNKYAQYMIDKETGKYLKPEDILRKHKDVVKQALTEGKPVPPEVLKDYPELQQEGKAEAVPEEGKMNGSWYTEFERAKKDNDFAALNNLYTKVKIALNGVAQGKGDETVQQFEQLKKDLEDYAAKLNIKQAEQPTAPEPAPSGNKIVTDDRYEELKRRMKDKLNNLTAGYDPEMFAIGAEMAMYHIEKGARKFKQFVDAMVNDLGKKIKPFLKSFYKGARNMPGMEAFAKDMDSDADVDAYDLEAEVYDTKSRSGEEIKEGDYVVYGYDARTKGFPVDQVIPNLQKVTGFRKSAGVTYPTFEDGKRGSPSSEYTIIPDGEELLNAQKFIKDHIIIVKPGITFETKPTLTTAVKPDKDTRDNSDIYLTKPTEKVDYDIYKDYLKIAKANNGTYSRYKKSFLFTTQADAEKFRQAIETKYGEQQDEPRSTEVIGNEVAAIESEAADVSSPQQAGDLIERANALTAEIDSKLQLLGVYEPDKGAKPHEYPHKLIEAPFKRDLTKFSKELARLLGMEHDKDRRGKVEYASVNIAPIGGDGHIVLWMPNSEYGVYISVNIEEGDFVDWWEKFNIGKGAAIMWRVNTKKNKWGGMGNNFETGAITAGELAKNIRKELSHYVKQEQPSRPEFAGEHLANQQRPETYKQYEKVSDKYYYYHQTEGYTEAENAEKVDLGYNIDSFIVKREDTYSVFDGLIGLQIGGGSTNKQEAIDHAKRVLQSNWDKYDDKLKFSIDRRAVMPRYQKKGTRIITNPANYEEFKQSEIVRLGARHPANINEDQVKARYEKYLQSKPAETTDPLQWAKDNENKLIEKYLAENGKHLDPDKVRELFKPIGYDMVKVAEYREGEKYLVERIYAEMLKRYPDTGVVLVLGIPGAGKSNMVASHVLNGNIVFDSIITTNEKLARYIKIASDREVKVVVIHSDPSQAFSGTIARAIHTGRVIPVDYFLKALKIYATRDKYLKENFENEVIISNFVREGSEYIEFGTQSPDINYDITRDELLNILKNHPDYNKLTNEQLERITGQSQEQARKRNDTGGTEGGREGVQRTDETGSEGSLRENETGGLREVNTTQYGTDTQPTGNVPPGMATGQQSEPTAVPPRTGQAETGSREDRGSGGTVAGQAGTRAGSRPGDSGGIRPEPGSPSRGDERYAGDQLNKPEPVQSDRGVPVLTPEDNHVIAPDDIIVPRGDTAKIAANIAAIKLAKKLDKQNRNATPEEKKILAKYVGWGGLSAVFKKEYYNDTWDKKYGKFYKELRDYLTEEEIQTAKESTINAHYTDRKIIEAMWRMVERLGFTGGRVLEPGGGIGHFFGLMPEKYRGVTQLRGIELDKLSGLIFQKLYPKANIGIHGFETMDDPNNKFNLVITNVPFGDVHVYDSQNKDIAKDFNLHNYFIAKSVRKLAPGGIGIFITTQATMDNEGMGNKFRKWLVDEAGGNADVIDAIRLPNNAFKENAGTEVTTDILIIQKRAGTLPNPYAKKILTNEAIAQTKTKEGDQVTIRVNEYYARNPKRMLGVMRLAYQVGAGGLYTGNSQTLHKPADFNLDNELNKIIGELPSDVFTQPDQPQQSKKEEEVQYAETGQKEGELIVKDGKVYQVVYGKLKEPEWNDNKVTGEGDKKYTKAQIVSDYINLKEVTRNLLNAEVSEMEDEGIEQLRKELNRLYDNFRKKYGQLNGNIRIRFLEEDVESALVFSLENTDQDAVTINDKIKYVTTATKSDIFSKRINKPRSEPKTAEGIEDAVDISLAYRNTIDVPYIAELLNSSPEDVKHQILKEGIGFINPETGLLEDRDTYLSGQVRKKLESAKKGGKEFEQNVKELEKVIPKDIPIIQVDVQLGATWVPGKIIAKWIDKLLDLTKTSVYYNSKLDKWGVKYEEWTARYSTKVKSEYGVEGADAISLIKSALNQVQPIIYDYEGYGSERKAVKNDAKTIAAQNKINEIKSLFKQHIFSLSQEEKDNLERLYNDKYNAQVNKVYTIPDSLIYFPGASEARILRKHQKIAARRGLVEAVLLAHQVGTGKTYTLATIAMEMRRLRTAKKPMVVVQRATISQFSAAFKRLYPNARILVPGKNDLERKNRQRLFAQIAMNDWDAVIIDHNFLNRIPDKPDRQIAYIRQRIADLEDVQSGVGEDEGSRFIEHRIDKEIEALEDQIASLEAQDQKYREESKASVKDDAKAAINVRTRLQRQFDRSTDMILYFEDMGVDALIIDEAHTYKKLGFVTKGNNIKGIDTTGAKKTLSAKLKVQFILENNNNKNVVFSTGTPISNTMAEGWTMMNFLIPDRIKEYGVSHFDEFRTVFGSVEPSIEFTAAGTFKVVDRFSKYVNLPELKTLWQSVADVVLTEDIGELKAGVGTPLLKDGKFTTVELPMTDVLKSQMEVFKNTLRAWEKLPGKEKREKSHVPLVIFGLAKRAAIDVRLVDSSAPDDPNSKLNKAIENVMKVYTESSKYNGTQLIFCDQMNSSDGKFNVYDDIRGKLVEKGIPKDQIAIISEQDSDTKRQKLFDRMNSGEMRILIGSTEKLGIGVNVQERLKAVHHVDAPNRPMDFEQRNGRILRQGNLHLKMGIPVEVFLYGVEKTLDATQYQRLAIKDKFIKQMMSKGITTDRIVEDNTEDGLNMTFDQMMANLSGSQYAILHVKKMNDLRNVELARMAFQSKQISMNDELKWMKRNVDSSHHRVKELSEAKEFYDQYLPDGEITSIKINDGETVTDPKKFTETFNDYVEANKKKLEGEGKEIKAVIILNKKVKLVVTTRTKLYVSEDKKIGLEIVSGGELMVHDKVYVETGEYKTIRGMFNAIHDDVSTISAKIVSEKEYIERKTKDLEELKVLLTQTFPDEEKLKRLRQEVTELERKMEDETKEKKDEPITGEVLTYGQLVPGVKTDISTVIDEVLRMKGVPPIRTDILKTLYNAFVEGKSIDSLDFDTLNAALGIGLLEYNDYTTTANKEIIYKDGVKFVISPYGQRYIDLIKNRLETRKLVAAGLDFFPKESNIPEVTGEPLSAVNIRFSLTEEPLYHGTSRPITGRLTRAKAGTGVGWNNFEQGNGIYLTNNRSVANMFSALARQGEHLRNQDLTPLERLDKAGVDELGEVLNVSVAPDANILDIDNDTLDPNQVRRLLATTDLATRKVQSGQTILDTIKDKDLASPQKVINWLNQSGSIDNSYEFLATGLGYDGIKLADQRMKTWDYWREDFGEAPGELPTTYVIYNEDKLAVESVDPRLMLNPNLKRQEFVGEAVFDFYKQKEQFNKEVREQLQQMSDEIGVKVNILQGEGQLPRYLREVNQQKGVSGRTPALYDRKTGEVYIIINNLKSSGHARRAFLHEVIAHKGLRALMGEEFDNILYDVYQSMTPTQIRVIGEKYKTKDIHVVADEFLAQQAEKDVKLDFIERALARIRQWFRHFFGLRYTDKDIAYLMRQSKRNLQRNKIREAVKETEFAGDVVRNSLTLYHGTPHEFDKFSMDKIGTGEGAQAFGYGLYFTDLKDVAEYYADSPDAARQWMVNLKVRNKWGDEVGEFTNPTIKNGRIIDSDDLFWGGSAKQIFNQIVKEEGGITKLKFSAENDFVGFDDLKGIPLFIKSKPIRTLITATIHKGKEADQYDYLRWDKVPTDGQIDKIKRVFDYLTNKETDYHKASELSRKYDNDYFKNKTGEEIYREIVDIIWNDRYRPKGNAEQLASSHLLLEGIDGIKYPAESKGDNARGFNYVVFDENAIEIEDRLRFSLYPKTPLTALEWLEEEKLIKQRSVGSSLEGIKPQIQTPLTETPEFKAWFGNSKVVDENGKPKIMYHATANDFDAFNFLNAPSFSSMGKGIYLGYSPHGLNRYYRDGQLVGGNIMPLFVKANPIDWDELEKLVYDKYGRDEVRRMADDDLTDLIRSYAEELGYDAITTKGMMLVFSPSQLKSATGNIGTFDETNPDIRYSLNDPTFVQPTPEEAIIGEPMLKTEAEKFREWIQDKMLSVRNLQIKLQKEGGTVNDLSDIYNDENRAASRSKAQMEAFHERIWTPLIDLASKISKGYNMSLDDIRVYLIAKHAPGRNKEFNEKYETKDEIYAGKIRGYDATEAVTSHYIDQFEGVVPKDVIDELWEKIGTATDYTLDRWLNDGFISRQVYDEIRSKKEKGGNYEFYVPLRGWKAETADEVFDYQDTDIGSGFNPFKKAFGRKSEADDPLAYIWSMANTAIVSGNRNLVKQKLLNLYRQNKDRTDLFNIQKSWLVEDDQGNAQEVFEKPDQVLFDAGKVKTKYNSIHHPRITRYMAKQHEVRIMEGGVSYLMTTTDPNVAIAINSENIVKPGTFVEDWIAPFTRYISTMLTSKNPAFIPVNWIRDVGMASMWHLIREEGDMVKFQKNIPIAFQAIRRSFNGQADKFPNQTDKLYKAWYEGGGATGYVHLKDIEQLKKRMEREFRVLMDERKKMDYVTTNKVVVTAGEWMDYLAQMSENMSRFATYMTSLELGRTHEQAITDSKNVTVNFNRKGRVSGLLNSLFAFFNANVQGAHTLLKLGKDYPKKFTEVAIGFMVLGYLSSMLARLLSPPDEDGVKYYDKLSPFIKQNFLVLPNPMWWILGKGKDKFVTIPLPWGFSALYSMGVVAHDWQTKQISVGDGLFDIATNIYSAFSPVNFGKGVIEKGELLSAKGLRPFIPTAVTPLYDIAINEDFAGYQVFREPFTKQLEKITPEAELGMPYTNRYLTVAARALNKFAGGDEVRKARWRIDPQTGELKDQGLRSIFDVNPSKLEHLLEGYTGGVGTELNNVVKTITAAVDKAQGKPGVEIYTRNIPVLRRLYRQASVGSNSREYYEFKNQVDVYTYLINKYKHEGMAEPYGKMIQYDQIKSSQYIFDRSEKALKKLKDRVEKMPEDSEELPNIYDLMDEVRTQAVIKIKELNLKER